MTSTSLVDVDDLDHIRELVRQAGEGEQLHPVGLRQVVSGPGAVALLPQTLAGLGVLADGVVAVLSDDVPKVGPHGDVLAVVTAAVTQLARAVPLVLQGSAGLVVHADEATLAQATADVAALGRGGSQSGGLPAAALVTVGSGTMADIGKVVAQRQDLPHVIVQTAASVNGYSDDQSVLLVHGTKRTTPSRWPDVLVIDSDVVATAPLAMTQSGLGDLVSTYTAAADWRLAALVGFDPSYSPTAVAVLRAGIDQAMAGAAGLKVNDPNAVRALAWSLTRGGLAMGIAGRTSPSSGAEHTISHLLEMHANARHGVAAPHGAQVGAAAVVVARVWATMRARLRAGTAQVRPLDEAGLMARVMAAFGPLDPTGAVAGECWSAYERKLRWVNAHLTQIEAVCAGWDRHDDAVGELLVEPEALARTLRAAGATVSLAELDPDPGPDAVRWAVANCHLMRDRFTVVDLAEVTGCWSDDDVDEAMG